MTTSASSPVMGAIEEETNPDYDPKRFYPARVGETIHQNYQIVSKLGWGTGSTVWLAKDTQRWPWQANRYVALKITNCFEGDQKSAKDELEISIRIREAPSEDQGRRYVRSIQDSFSIPGPFGQHMCFVFEPLREPLWMLGRHLGRRNLPPNILKAFLKVVLEGLDFLHNECHIIHTDLKSDNFLLGFEDSTVIEDYVRNQQQDPAYFKEIDGRRVYQSRPDFGHLRKGTGMVKITDFGAAVPGDAADLHMHNIQPQQFCAPEVILRAGWTYSADIWNLGMVLWELLEDTSLLDGMNPDTGEYSREFHFAQMISLLGPAPSELLNRADKAVYDDLYTSQGVFKYSQHMLSKPLTLSDRTPFLEGEDKRLFVEFASRMLQWLPGDRPTAKELSNDPWLSYNI